MWHLHILLTLSNRCADELHLAPLSAVVQLRPQLHHLDAFDEVTIKNKGLSRGRRDLDGEAGPRPAEPEARAIDMKVKSAESGNTNLAGNNELLKRIQDERWERYSWIDENVSRQENLPSSSFYVYKVLIIRRTKQIRTKNHGINMKNLCSISRWRNHLSWCRRLMPTTT